MSTKTTCSNEDCILVTCNIWAMAVGQLMAMAYIRLMFGVEHAAGQPPKYCAFNIEPRGCPLRMVQGSLYVWDYRIHHWLFYLMLLPLFVGFGFYLGIGFASCMIVHGLWYEDRFEWKYKQAQQGQIEKHLDKFRLDHQQDEEDSTSNLIVNNKELVVQPLEDDDTDNKELSVL